MFRCLKVQNPLSNLEIYSDLYHDLDVIASHIMGYYKGIFLEMVGMNSLDFLVID